MRLLFAILISISFTAVAREIRAPSPWLDRCQRLLRRVRGPARDHVVRAVLRANVEAPQRDDYIYLAALAAYLEEPAPSSVLLRPADEDEARQMARAMDRAHAAFGVDAYSEFASTPGAKTITRARLDGLLQGPAMALALTLEKLRDELKDMPPRYRRTFRGPPAQHFLRMSWLEQRRVNAANEDFFYYGDRERRARLADWGRRLKTVLVQPPIRSALRDYRDALAEGIRRHGTSGREFERHHDRIVAPLAKAVLNAARAEFKGRPEDRAIWKVLRDLEIATFGRARE